MDNKKIIKRLQKARQEIDRALALLAPESSNLTESQMEYLARFEIVLGAPYVLANEVVRPFAANGDKKNSGESLNHGFIHFKNNDGEIKFCGVGYFQDNAVRIP